MFERLKQAWATLSNKEKEPPVLAETQEELIHYGPPPVGKAYILTDKGWVMVDKGSEAAKRAWNYMD
jgi:hypothetical protein